jgi:hypothetical protein
VRPLGRGRGVLNASLGGPLVTVAGATIPVPIVSIGGGYGVRDDLDVTLHADITAAAFGTVHVEPGFVLHPVISESGWIPTVTVGASAHLLTDFREVRVVPQLVAAVGWRIARKHFVYAGNDLGLAFGESFRALWAPFVGGEARIGRVGIALEGKWIAPYYDTTPTAPAWVSPGGHGYASLLLGVNVYFGGVE